MKVTKAMIIQHLFLYDNDFVQYYVSISEVSLAGSGAAAPEA